MDLSLILGVAGTFVTLVGGAVAIYRVGHRRGSKDARRSLNDESLRKRYEVVYAPMDALFLTRHITSSSAVMAPYVSMRIKRAWVELRKGRLRKALVAISDRRRTKESAEVEFGGAFPLKDIQQILTGNEAYADETLLRLVAHADRSRYEAAVDGPRDYPNALTDEEFELFRHIAATRVRLSEVFVADR